MVTSVLEDTTSKFRVASSRILNKMDVRGSSVMLVTIYMITRHQTQADHSSDICKYENLKFKG